MKRNIVRTIFFAMLLLSLAVVASAQIEKVCSNAMVAGTWGYTETGTLILPTGAVPYASVGSYTLDFYGNLSGARTASANGTILKATIKGTATVNSDCTGTLTVSFYDESGKRQGTADTVKAIVYVDNGKEARMIIISGNYPSVLTTEAKKLFPIEWPFFY